MRKKRVVFNSDLPTLKTGLARNSRAVLEYLWKTNKYELIAYCCGCPWDNPEYSRFPFKVIGAMPNSQEEYNTIAKDPAQARFISYGGYYIDRVIKEFKPDVLISSNDHWAMDSWVSRPWWNKINCVSHVTIDSLPFLDQNINLIKNSKHYYSWATFGEKEAKRLGFDHVKTLTGAVNSRDFYRLSDNRREELRNKFGLEKDAFIVGYVFRNQLRKELKPIMEGFKTFIKENPQVPAYLLLHTNFSEPGGWNIPAFCKELNIDPKRILTTYVCKVCHNYEVKTFTGEKQKCKHCGAEGDNGQTTCNVSNGVTEKELNEIYNLMDCVAHVFNAGGLEYPLVESLFCEIPLATVPYSSGEMFTDQPFVETIDITYTVQHGTQFIRAVPLPYSIFKFFKKIYNMDSDKKREIGKLGREWALKTFSIEVIGKQWEDIIDAMPEVDWDFNFEPKAKEPDAIIDNIENDKEWVRQLYNKILKVEPDLNGWNYWENLLKNGSTREQIHQQFKNIAIQDNQKNQVNQIKFEDVLDNTGRKRFLIVCKESIGDLLYVSSLLKDFKEQYHDHDLYLACDPVYMEIFDGNPYLHKVLAYQPFMESEIHMTGAGKNKGFFDGYCFPAVLAQRFLSYLTNDKISYNLNY